MGSGFVPVNTVQAVAIWPRWTSLRGKNPPPEGGGLEGAGTSCATSGDVIKAASRGVASLVTKLRNGRTIDLEQGFTSIRLNRSRIAPGKLISHFRLRCA